MFENRSSSSRDILIVVCSQTFSRVFLFLRLRPLGNLHKFDILNFLRGNSRLKIYLEAFLNRKIEIQIHFRQEMNFWELLGFLILLGGYLSG